MRFSPAKLSWSLTLAAAACATSNAPTPKSGGKDESQKASSLSRDGEPPVAAAAPTAAAPKEPTPPLASLTELQHQEFLSPRDPHTKLLLGYRLYCDNARGPAIEKWLWILQFAPSSPDAATARALVQSVNSKQDAFKNVPGAPDCPNHPL